MWMTNVSPPLVAGSPVASCNMPELSMVTCPCGSLKRAKIRPGSAGIGRAISIRSVDAVSSVMTASWHRTVPGGASAVRGARRRHQDLGLRRRLHLGRHGTVGPWPAGERGGGGEEGQAGGHGEDDGQAVAERRRNQMGKVRPSREGLLRLGGA